MPTIQLPHGGGQSIETADLRAEFHRRGVEHMTISARRVDFANHPRQLSVDYWIRAGMNERQNTAQATRAFVDSLVETGEFEKILAECPQGGTLVDSIRLTGAIMGQVDDREFEISELKFIETTAKNVACYIKGIEDGTKDFVWSWNVPQHIANMLDETEAGRAEGMHAAKRLKSSIRRRLAAENDPEIRSALFTFFVRDFGGVRTNQNLSEKIVFLEELCRIHNRDVASTVGLEGISTVSKCLTVLNEQYPIYDARVGYSLNAINWMAGDRDIYLPMPKGRNTRLELIDIRALFLISSAERCKETQDCLAAGAKGASRALRKFSLSEDRVYDVYCKTLRRTVELLPSSHPLDIDQVEMALFAGASQRLLHNLLDSVSPALSYLNLDR